MKPSSYFKNSSEVCTTFQPVIVWNPTTEQHPHHMRTYPREALSNVVVQQADRTAGSKGTMPSCIRTVCDEMEGFTPVRE